MCNADSWLRFLIEPIEPYVPQADSEPIAQHKHRDSEG